MREWAWRKHRKGEGGTDIMGQRDWDREQQMGQKEGTVRREV